MGSFQKFDLLCVSKKTGKVFNALNKKYARKLGKGKWRQNVHHGETELKNQYESASSAPYTPIMSSKNNLQLYTGQLTVRNKRMSAM